MWSNVFIVVLCAMSASEIVSAGATARELLAEAEARIRDEQFAAADSILSEARKLEPRNVEIIYRLGYVRFRDRKLAAARNDFAEAVKLAPPAWYSRYFLGRIALLEGKPHEAVTWLEPILAANES